MLQQGEKSSGFGMASASLGADAVLTFLTLNLNLMTYERLVSSCVFPTKVPELAAATAGMKASRSSSSSLERRISSWQPLPFIPQQRKQIWSALSMSSAAMTQAA